MLVESTLRNVNKSSIEMLLMPVLLRSWRVEVVHRAAIVAWVMSLAEEMLISE